MIIIGGNVSALIMIGDEFEVDSRQFVKLVLVDNAGGGLPIMEMHLSQYSLTLYQLLDTSPVITMSVGSDRTNQFKTQFKVKDFNFEGDSVVITGLLHLPKHKKVGDQKFYEGNLSDILANELSLPGDVYVPTKDKQIWIRDGGTSEWDFVNDAIQHAWVSDSDSLIHGYSIEGRLIVASINGILGEKDETKYYTFSNSPELDERTLRYSSLKPESNKAFWDKQFVDRSLPVFHMLTREVKSYTNPDRKGADDLVPLPQIIDCGNCHENYYQAQMNYISRAAKLGFNTFWLDPNHYLNLRTIKLLDKVEIIAQKSDKTQLADPTNGSYLVGGRSVVFTQSKSYIRYKLLRPGFSNQVNAS